MRRTLPLLALVLILPSSAASQERGDFAFPTASALLQRLAISVDPARPRTFIYTNKRASFFAGETSGPNKDPNQGLNVFGRKVLEDYDLAVDGNPLDRASVRAVTVFPHALVRRYANGVSEEVTMLDGIDALLITLTLPTAARVSLTPRFPAPAGAKVTAEASGLFVTPAVGGDIAQKAPRTVGVTASGRLDVSAGAGVITSGAAKEIRFVIAVGSGLDDAKMLVSRLNVEALKLAVERRERIARLLLDCYVETADPTFDKAFLWNVASGDALVTDQAGPGIWAGLYWFNNYWGRDTFISLPGISLVTGRFADARRILESFAKYQKTDPLDPLYGRVPNRVNSPTDVIYNTADGTPWFVREAFEYVEYSGDIAFAQEIYPAVRMATAGALKYRVDKNGLLTHADADTWMDAQWEGKTAWTPRGDRAVDVQALWYAQLVASARLAEIVGDNASARRWDDEASRVRSSFRRLFRDESTGILYDHLNADGTADRQVRPNQIFALTVPRYALLSDAEAAPVLRQVVNEVTYEYGVASLAQSDPSFHPYHHDERWHYDSAYHNGTVWVWNAGPVVEALTRYRREDLAFRLTQAMVRQTLEHGAVGTLSELIDAIPREDRHRLSGTETQAWSVAEFVRVLYQAYLGVRPDAIAGQLSLDAAVPTKLGIVRAVIPYKGDRIKLTVERMNDSRYRYTLFASRLAEPIVVHAAGAKAPVTLRANSALEIVATRPPLAADADPGPLAFAKPQILAGLKALSKEPTTVRRLLATDAAVREPSSAQVLYEATDPARDDTGPNGRYSYPTDGHYEPGILDLTGVRVAVDKDRYYFTLRFRHLADPGWHPELGFQLTYAAVLIDSASGSGATAVGKSSGYVLPPHLGFERAIYIGGALELADADGKSLATYSPASREAALGDAASGVIHFSIPRELIGEPSGAMRFSVVVGGQDDGGAAGLGVFRAVKQRAEQWSGGGAESNDVAPRVYDVLLPEK